MTKTSKCDTIDNIVIFNNSLLIISLILTFLRSKKSCAYVNFLGAPMYHQHPRGRSRLERDRTTEYDEYAGVSPRDNVAAGYHHPHHHHPHHHQPQEPSQPLHHHHHQPHHSMAMTPHYGPPSSRGNPVLVAEERYRHRGPVRDADDYHSPHRASSRRALNAI